MSTGHRLKNAGCKLNVELKRYKAKHRLLLTGMPACWRSNLMSEQS